MPSRATTDSRPSLRRRVGPLGRELLVVVVGALIVSAVLRAFVGQMFIIPSGSMENTLMEGDRVAVQKITDFHRGSVVVFHDPADWLDEPTTPPTVVERVLQFVGVPTDADQGYLIKRVIGMPGDTVVCCDHHGRMTVNGTALDETSYLYATGGEQVAPSDFPFKVVVPAGRIFVMGDHRDASADSRCHLSEELAGQEKGQVAFVPVDLVVGPAFAVVAPFHRATRLQVPTTFTTVPDPTAAPPAIGVIQPENVVCS